MSAMSPNFESRAADCSRRVSLRQRMLGRQVWYAELTAVAASDYQQNADDNEQQCQYTVSAKNINS